LVFSGLALGILAIIRTAWPTWMPDPGMLFGSGGTYVAQHYRLVLWALVAEGTLALGAVGLVHLLLAKKQGSAIRPVSTWRQVFRRDCPAGCDVFVRVRLSSGVVYIGALAAYTADPDDAGGELALGPPMFSRKVDGALTAVPQRYQRVVIPRSAIEVLSVEYRPTAASGPAPASAPAAAAASGPAPVQGNP
jgi:hypothetical protein